MKHPSLAVAIGVPVCLMAASAVALSIEPIYHYVVNDAVTGDNEFQGSDGKRRWDVDAGADDPANGVYERPTTDASQAYLQNLDITKGKVGWDDQFLYVGIEHFGRDRSHQGGDTPEGLIYQYGFRFNTGPNGERGYQFVSDNPELEHGASFGLESDALYARIDPANPNTVEFALDYTSLGLGLQDIVDLDTVDLQSIGEAGSRDSVRVHTAPEPSTVAMMGMGCLGLSLFGRRARATRRRAL